MEAESCGFDIRDVSGINRGDVPVGFGCLGGDELFVVLVQEAWV